MQSVGIHLDRSFGQARAPADRHLSGGEVKGPSGGGTFEAVVAGRALVGAAASTAGEERELVEEIGLIGSMARELGRESGHERLVPLFENWWDFAGQPFDQPAESEVVGSTVAAPAFAFAAVEGPYLALGLAFVRPAEQNSCEDFAFVAVGTSQLIEVVETASDSAVTELSSLVVLVSIGGSSAGSSVAVGLIAGSFAVERFVADP